MRTIPAVFVAAMIASTGWAQTKEVTPPPKPADEGPSLEATLRFIQNHLNEDANVNYVTTANNGGWRTTSETSEAAADAATCKLSYTVSSSTAFDSTSLTPTNGRAMVSFLFRDVSKVEVMSMTDWNNRESPSLDESIRWKPEIYYVIPHMSNGKKVRSQPLDEAGNELVAYHAGQEKMAVLSFRDEDMAKRVAKAMVHAVELCGEVAPPPDTSSEGPSLDVTMSFIQKVLNERGRVVWLETWSQPDWSSTTENLDELSEAVANAATCTLSYKQHRTRGVRGTDGSVSPQASLAELATLEFSFRDVSFLSVSSDMEVNRGQSVKTDFRPNIYSIGAGLLAGKRVRYQPENQGLFDGKNNSFARLVFTDGDLAKRLGKAIVHAVELCNGGKDNAREEKEPF